MSAIMVINTVLILLAVLLVVWTWTNRTKSKKTEVQPDSSSSKTQKISAIGKTIFGALKKVIYWGLILGLIAGVALVVYCFLFPSAKPELLNRIPFFSSFSQQSKTKVIYYTPNAQVQTVHVGEGKWNFKIAATKGYYEVPKYGLTRAQDTEVPATGKKCWDASILPYKDTNYYGGVLANSRPNGKPVKSDDKGCVKISLNLPEKIKEVKANEKVKLIFTSIS